MNNELIIFEGQNLEVLTKEDVSFNFNGEVLFNGKQVCSILEYSNDRDALSKHVRENQKYKVKNSDVAKHDFRQLNNAGETFITEKGVMKLIISSKMPKAEEFEDRVWDIVSEVQKTGRYDVAEQKLMQIKDPIERDLKIAIYKLEDIMKSNTNDMLMILNYNSKKQELSTHLQNKKIDLIADKIDNIGTKINKTTVLREGDMSPEAIAKKFNIFSVNGNPHNKFADNMARMLGFYINPEGNIGYSDDYVSINLTSRGGVTVPTIKYSIKAVKEMEDYIETDGLRFENPPTYYKRKCKGGNVGDFNYCRILFDDLEESIKVNKVTYNLYNNSEK